MDERTVELACAALEEFLRADRFGARTARQWRPFLSICGAAPGLTFPPMGVFFPLGHQWRRHAGRAGARGAGRISYFVTGMCSLPVPFLVEKDSGGFQILKGKWRHYLASFLSWIEMVVRNFS